MSTYQGEEQRKDIVLCVINVCKKQSLLHSCSEKITLQRKCLFLSVHLYMVVSHGLIPLFGPEIL